MGENPQMLLCSISPPKKPSVVMKKSQFEFIFPVKVSWVPTQPNSIPIAIELLYTKLIIPKSCIRVCGSKERLQNMVKKGQQCGDNPSKVIQKVNNTKDQV